MVESPAWDPRLLEPLLAPLQGDTHETDCSHPPGTRETDCSHPQVPVKQTAPTHPPTPQVSIWKKQHLLSIAPALTFKMTGSLGPAEAGMGEIKFKR